MKLDKVNEPTMSSNSGLLEK